MTHAEQDQVVGTFPLDRPDQPLRVAVLARPKGTVSVATDLKSPDNHCAQDKLSIAAEPDSAEN